MKRRGKIKVLKGAGSKCRRHALIRARVTLSNEPILHDAEKTRGKQSREARRAGDYVEGRDDYHHI